MPFHTRKAVAAAALLLAACGGGGDTPVVPTGPGPAPTPPVADGSGTPVFQERSAFSGLVQNTAFAPSYSAMASRFAGGAAVGDVDGDGDDDLVLLRGAQAPALLLNAGGEFTERADAIVVPAGHRLSGPVLGDMDGDGDLDLFIGGLEGDGARLFAGDGQGGFVDATPGSGLDGMGARNTLSAALGDYDADGDLDLLLAHWGTPRTGAAGDTTETLWRNEGSLVFSDASVDSGAAAAVDATLEGKLGRGFDYTFAPNFVDADGDGALDILMVADFRGSRVLMGRGDGTFADVTDPTQITDTNGMGTDIGDVDGDGAPDWFVTSINANHLYRNERGAWIDRGQAAGLAAGSWGWGTCLADLDADGRLDAVQTNGWHVDTGSPESEPYSEDRTRLWLAQPDGSFENRAAEANIADSRQTRAVICHDFDGDTDIDLLLLVNGDADGVIYHRNETTGTRAVTVRLSGPLHGVGAVVEARSDGVVQTRWVRAGSTFTAQTPGVAHFGLGDANAADITVRWPDGTEQVQAGVAAGTALVVRKP